MTLDALWHICAKQSRLESESPVPGARTERWQKSDQLPYRGRGKFISKSSVGPCYGTN